MVEFLVGTLNVGGTLTLPAIGSTRTTLWAALYWGLPERGGLVSFREANPGRILIRIRADS